MQTILNIFGVLFALELVALFVIAILGVCEKWPGDKHVLRGYGFYQTKKDEEEC